MPYLLQRTYRHGSRSLEFFISMSPLLGEKKWNSSLLPPRSQMNIHVDAEEFMSKITVLAMCKELAKISHEMYLEAELAKTPNKDLQAVTHWENLSETYKKSNIAQISITSRDLTILTLGLGKRLLTVTSLLLRMRICLNWPWQSMRRWCKSGLPTAGFTEKKG